MVIDTGRSATLCGLSACRHLYEGLYKLDAEGNVVLGQAENVEVSDDELTYTFTLRDDITWSDGEPVTAGDFVYGWQYLKDCSADYSTLLDMVASAEATDDKTLVVTLNYACSYLPSVLAFPSAYPVRQDMWRNMVIPTRQIRRRLFTMEPLKLRSGLISSHSL